jgi:RecB family exonuclease
VALHGVRDGEEVIRLTNSEAKTWRRCKRKWYLGTYRGLQKRGRDFNKPLSIGTRIHDALSSYYQPGLERDPKVLLDHVRTTVEKDVEEHPTLEKDIRKEGDLCTAMLEGYIEWLEETGEDADLRVVEAESEMEVPLIDGATILSKIDVRVEKVSDGERGALEHKTVGSLTDPVRRLQVDTQLLTEHLVEFLHLLEEGREENRAKFVLYNMMRKVKRTARAKPPFFAREHVTHNVDELRSHWRHVAAVAREINETRARLDSGEDHHDVCYPNPTADCTWDCEFKEVCLSGQMDDGSDYEAHLADEFELVDPLERYRRLVGLPAGEGKLAEVGS